MKTFTVSFFGHRQICDIMTVERKLEKYIREFLTTEEFAEFLVGRDGEFDLLVASTVRRCKRECRNDNSALVLVLPYMTAEYRDNEESFRKYYDEIEVCFEAEKKYFKAAHQIRNRTMADRSDIIIFCVDHNSGGAFQTLQYAKNNKVAYVNLCDKVKLEK